MADRDQHLLLTINTGSSSLKAAVYRGEEPAPLLHVSVSRIGASDARLDLDGKPAAAARALADHGDAIDALLSVLVERRLPISGVGHRLVHGGPRLVAPALLDAAVRAELASCVPLAPLHLPQALMAIDRLAKEHPELPQVACFDTAFHATLPERAHTLALPRDLAEQGVRRYGFHGLSYEYLVRELSALDPANVGGRAVLMHLGNGASMAAVLRGVSIDTTMGFSPTGGLVMGTRSGDLDPGALVYALAHGYVKDAAELSRLVTQRSGLLGVSGTSSDMRDLLAARRTDARAALAVDLFTYQARKQVGAFAAALGGLDTIVLTGGIGEHAPEIRAELCAGLEFLGVTLDAEANTASAPVLSRKDAPVTVRLMTTDEDAMIQSHTLALLRRRSR